MLRNSALSFKSRGILSMVLTHSDEWEVHSLWISKQGTEGREAVASAMCELEEAGYVRFEEIRDAAGSGRIIAAAWTFSDTPFSEDQRTNKTRWRGHNTASRLTASRLTANHLTALPSEGKPATKNIVGEEENKTHQTIARPVVKLGPQPGQPGTGNLLSMDEIKATLLPFFGRPPTDHLGGDEMYELTKATITAEELAALVRFYKLSTDSKKIEVKSRKHKFLSLLQNWREQVGLAVKACPPPRSVPAPTPIPQPPQETEEELEARKQRTGEQMRQFRESMGRVGAT